MTEMLGKFIHEALECLILIPATVLYFLLMKDRMKYPLKKVLPLFSGILAAVVIIVSVAAALLPIDPTIVFYILLIPLFLPTGLLSIRIL